ncbi:MAG: hypothetical protein KDB14_12940 [Planctomycetales bacterium]|nr:hypothetical protein [Planctomycetales bacterium]
MHKKILPFVALALTGFLTPTTHGEEDYQIVAVEETWSFTIGEPDPSKTSPQVSTMMGPFNSARTSHFVFTLNHTNSPSFSPGGMQIQLWNGESLQSYVSGPKTGVLSNTGETVRWTQRLSVNNGTATFEVKSGSSTTWGSFGGQGYLKATVGGVTDFSPLKVVSVAYFALVLA